MKGLGQHSRKHCQNTRLLQTRKRKKNCWINSGKGSLRRTSIVKTNIMKLQLNELEIKAAPATIAIIDSGADFLHPYLTSKIWINKKEIPNNNVDDDKNGFIDDVRGWNFIGGNNNIKDDNGHGTHVAGIAGKAGHSQLMILKVLDGYNSGSHINAARAVRYAVNNGAKIISMSFGGESNYILNNMIKWAISKNVIVVAAAGNDAYDLKKAKVAPAYLNNVISVSSLESNGLKLANYSNYNGTIAAIGSGVLSSMPNGKYGRYSGTSMATPLVASAINMIVDKFPNWNTSDVLCLLKKTSDSFNKTELGKLNFNKLEAELK